MIDSSKLNPFYIHVVVWGEKFRHYLLDYAIPSLLSPRNLPALVNGIKNKFLFCTTREDWTHIQKHPTFAILQKYITPVFIAIPPPPPHVSGCQHMSIGHKLATEMCFHDQAYGIALTPDLVLSDGALTYIENCALKGKDVVFCAAIRFAEEPFFAHLKKLGIQIDLSSASLTLSGSELVDCAIHAFHSETSAYDFHAAHYVANAPITLQRIKDEGLLIHSMSWCPLLLNYGAISQHDTHTFEKWTMDGDYVYRNFAQTDAIEVSTDSEEVMLISWAPLIYNQQKLASSPLRRFSKYYRQWFNSMTMRAALKNPIYDPMKIKLFSTPVYWHRFQIGDDWLQAEKSFQTKLNRPENFTDRFFIKYLKFLYIGARLRHFCYMLTKAFLGDREIQARINKKINNFFNREIHNESR